MRVLVAASVLLASTLSATPAAADWPDDLFVGTAFGALHWGTAGFGVSVGGRVSWTRLDAPLAMGADLEVAYRFDHEVVRLAPALRVVPGALMRGTDCERLVLKRARGNDFGLGPTTALTLGPLLELGSSPRFGVAAGVVPEAYLLGGHLRAAWMAERGPELELGLGARLPSIVGDVDVAIICE
jgi:hypothetical protein